MAFPWLNIRLVTASEFKIAIIVAILATLAVVISTVWPLFMQSSEQEPPIQVMQSSEIHITPKPATTTFTKNTPSDTIANNKPSRVKQTQENLRKKESPQPQKKHTAQTSTKQRQQVVIGQGHLFVQVGAFKEINHARLMFKKMKAKYKRASIISKAQHHLVWVGPVATRSDAEKLKTNIRRQDKIKGFITSK